MVVRTFAEVDRIRSEEMAAHPMTDQQPSAAANAVFLKVAQGEEAKAPHQEIERTSWLRLQGINVPKILDAIIDAQMGALLEFTRNIRNYFKLKVVSSSSPISRIDSVGHERCGWRVTWLAAGLEGRDDERAASQQGQGCASGCA